MKRITILLAVILNCWLVTSQNYKASWASIDTRPVPDWFQDAKFGIFIHWGVYSVPAWRKVEPGRYASYAEWYYARVMDNKKNGGYQFHRDNYGVDFEYRDFAKDFKAELFEPVQWAELFNRAGARYVVLTSKHHDGYCLWPTNNPHKKGWNAGDSGPERDLVGDLTKAVRKEGLKMGLYYSIPDWESVPRKTEPLEYFIQQEFVDKYGLSPVAYRDEILLPQLKEIVNDYQPSLIFSDAGEWTYDDEFWKTKEFLAWLYNDSPCKEEVVVNDRWCKGMPGKHGDYYSSEYKDADANAFNKPWEESRGIGGSYGFNRAENAEDYSSAKALIIEFIDIVSRGGNLLLNIGPTADGRIPVVMQERLLEIGDWLKVNGEAVYGSRKAKVNNQAEDLFFTQKDEHLYCFFTAWKNEIELPVGEEQLVENITLLGCDEQVEWSQSGQKIKVTIPGLTVNELPCCHAWVLKVTMGK